MSSNEKQFFRRLAKFLRGSNAPQDAEAFKKTFLDIEGSKDPEFIDKLTETDRQGHKKRLFENIGQSIAANERQARGEKEKRTVIYSPWWRAAAAVALLIASGAVLLSFFPQWSERLVEVEQSVLPGMHKDIILSDGTVVSLNGGSSIRYSRWFLGDSRKVALAGEAFFKVKRDEDKPFIVQAGSVSTTVLGTSFNVKAYTDLKQTTVSVATGKVQIRQEGQQLSILTANQEIIVDEKLNKYAVDRSVDINARLAWREGKLVFDNYTMREVAILLSNYYQVEFVFADSTLKEKRITGDFDSGTSLEKVLGRISFVNRFRYQIDNNNVTISPADSDRK